MVRALLLVMALLLTAVGQTRADPILYSNGPINGTANGTVSINLGTRASDTFTLANASSVTGAQVGIWTSGLDGPSGVQWSIGTTAFGSDKGSGTAGLTSTFLNNSSGIQYYASTFSLNQQLGSGTYWLTLQNASVPPNATPPERRPHPLLPKCCLGDKFRSVLSVRAGQ